MCSLIHVVTPILLKKISFDAPARRFTTCYYCIPSFIRFLVSFPYQLKIVLPGSLFLFTSLAIILGNFSIYWPVRFLESPCALDYILLLIQGIPPRSSFPSAQYQCLFVHHISECPVNSPFSLKTTTFDFIFPSSACLGFLFPLLQIFARKLSLYCLNSCSLLCSHSA